MPNYRRNYEGRCYFLTLVTYGRRPIFSEEPARKFLREAIDQTCRSMPWTMEAIVLLPDHLHMLWTLPQGDSNYSGRISAIKKRFTRAFLASGDNDREVTNGQKRHRRRGIWQERFWEHTIRDAKDFHIHLDYIHLNPVKHGLAAKPFDWPWSSFRRYVDEGWFEPDWFGRADLPGTVEYTSID